jgi:hypothetical protein
MNFLIWLADLLNISYEAVNVWIFCVLLPLLIVYLFYKIYRQQKQISHLEVELRSTEAGVAAYDRELSKVKRRFEKLTRQYQEELKLDNSPTTDSLSDRTG